MHIKEKKTFSTDVMSAVIYECQVSFLNFRASLETEHIFLPIFYSLLMSPTGGKWEEDFVMSI